MSEKHHILFVDDEPKVLHGIQRMLSFASHDWELSYAEDAQQALEILSRQPHDVVVTDIRMPGTSGVELLEQVRKMYPRTVRVALSGQADREALLRIVGPVQQFLSKPCDEQTLKSTLERACSLSRVLGKKELQALVSRIKSLPSLPTVYYQVVEELQREEPSPRKVGEVISQDMSMTAKVIQLVNSSFFGLPRHISSPAEAATYLGLEMIRALILSAHVFCVDELARVRGLDLRYLQAHCIAVGAWGKRIAQAEDASAKVVSHSLIAGLLHDIGRLILASNFPQEYAAVLNTVRAEEGVLHDKEAEVFGADHGALGGFLLGLWGLPQQVVEAAAFHHRPSDNATREFLPLTAVHVADVFEAEANPARHVGAQPKVDDKYMGGLGFGGKLAAWRSLQPGYEVQAPGSAASTGSGTAR